MILTAMYVVIQVVSYHDIQINSGAGMGIGTFNLQAEWGQGQASEQIWKLQVDIGNLQSP